MTSIPATSSDATENNRPYRVFLVDDHAVFRSGVRTELGREADMEIVGEAGGVAEAVAGIEATKPDVVLLDVHMPDGGGVASSSGSRTGRSAWRSACPTRPRTSSPSSAPRPRIP